MTKRVGRPFKEYVRTTYTEDELKTIYMALKSSSDKELKTKVKNDLKERKRLHLAYNRTIKKIFGDKP